MAHEYTITTSTDVSLSNLNDALAATPFERVFTESEQTATKTDPIDGPAEYRATVYAADTEARDTALQALKTAVSDAATATIDYRHTWRDYDDGRRSDEKYYPSDLITGLRADVSLSDTDDYTTTTTAAYRINDTNHNITDATHTHTPPSDYMRIDRLIGTPAGLEVLEGDPHGQPAVVGSQPSAPDTPADAVSLGTVVVKTVVDRIIRGGLTAETQVGEPTERTTIFEK